MSPSQRDGPQTGVGALPAWRRVVGVVGFVIGAVGLVLAVTGHVALGALLMGLFAIVTWISMMTHRLRFYSRGQRDA